jgi:hypothetical protein
MISLIIYCIYAYRYMLYDNKQINIQYTYIVGKYKIYLYEL